MPFFIKRQTAFALKQCGKVLFASLILFATGIQLPAQAPNPQGIYDPRVFNAADYLSFYPDLMNAYGADNSAGASDHWLKWGLKEGRRASFVFDPQYYLQNNPDLLASLGANGYESALQHFLSKGLAEGRRGSLEFDARYYLAHNPDLVTAFGRNGYAAAAGHFLQYGLNEGRQGSADFSVKEYMNMYPDMMAAYGPSGYREAMRQWLRRGKAQHRAGTGVPAISPECSGAAPANFTRIFIALRTDGHPGSGTVADPFDGSTAEEFDQLLRSRSEAKQTNLVVCIGPGLFRTQGRFDFVMNLPHTTAHGFTINKNWKIHGSGMNSTVLQLSDFMPDSYNMPKGTGTGVVFSTHDDGASGIEISDLTIDDNYPEMKALARQRRIHALNLDGMQLRSDNGGNWVHRVNIIHSAGEINETFPIEIFSVNPAVRSQNNLVEYVTMSGWGAGDCAAIALANATGEVRNNVVRDYEKGYGGWEFGPAWFHDNFAIDNRGYGFNVDTAANHEVVIEFNQIIHPRHYGIVVGGPGRYADFRIEYNTIQLNSDKAEGLIIEGHVTNAIVRRNNLVADHAAPHNIRALIIKGGGNVNNSYQGNYLRIGAEQFDVQPNEKYSMRDK